jgi:TP901 family phage tail tape measure protein
MSDIQKTIEIIFQGVDELSGPMGNMAGGLSDFSAKIEAMAQPFAQVGDAVLKLDAALAGMAAAGLAYAIKSGGDFTAQLNEINTMAGLSGDQLGIFSQDIINYAKDSTQSFESINNAIYQALSLGNDYETTLNTLRTAEQLAVAGKADLTASLELLLGTMNSYGAGVDEAGRYSDTFFTIVQNGKTTIPELAASLAQVTGVASSAGIPIETLGSAIAALTAAGSPTAQAMTQVKAVIESIINPTTSARKAAEDLGVSFGA